MRCTHCGDNESKVLDTRDSQTGIRRRRECLRCGSRYSTVEKLQTSTLSVVKQDGRVEEFNREKLLNGISIALAKRVLPSGSAEKIVEEIEEELHKRGREEISSKLIGELTMNALRIMDRVAYIRFASVYRDFADEDDFREAVEGLQIESTLFSTEQLALLPPDHSTSRRRGRPRKS